MENVIVCWYCDHEYEDWHEFVDPVDMVASFDMPCKNCGRDFHVNMTTTVAFESGPAEEEE